MSPVPLAQAQGPRLTQAYVREIVGEARRTYGVPAIALTVMDSGGIRHREAQGVRVLGRQDNATFDDYFHIGSCSKSALAVIAASLVEQKKIQWDTRFLDVFPELKAVADKAYAEIALEDLLLCRAGIKFARDGFSLGVANGDMLGRRYSGFDGATGTFYSRSIIVPDADFAFTIMTNAGSPNGSMEAVEWLSRKIVEKEFDLSWWRKLWLRLWW